MVYPFSLCFDGFWCLVCFFLYEKHYWGGMKVLFFCDYIASVYVYVEYEMSDFILSLPDMIFPCVLLHVSDFLHQSLHLVP